MNQTIKTEIEVNIGDADAPVQEAEHIITEILFELKDEGVLESYRVIGPA